MSSSHDTQSGSSTALEDRRVDLERFDPEAPPSGPRRWLGLSGTQVGSSAGAAVTSAVFASYFGVAGTLIGAALGSIVSTVAGALYSRSMERAAVTVRETHAVIVRRAGLTTALPTDLPAMRTTRENDRVDAAGPGPQSPAQGAGPSTLTLPAVDPTAPDPGAPSSPPGRRFAWLRRPLAFVGIGLAGFLLAVGAVTLAESVIGHPLSGGDSGSSVSKVFTGSSSGSSTGDDTDTPTAPVTPTATPSASATTRPSAAATPAPTTGPSAPSSTSTAPGAPSATPTTTGAPSPTAASGTDDPTADLAG